MDIGNQFSQALELAYSGSGGGTARRLEAEHYLMELQATEEGLNLSFHIITAEPTNELRCFWAFNTLIQQLPTLAAGAGAEQSQQLYQALFSFIYQHFFSSLAVPALADFTMSKHAQVMVVGLQSFYPSRWQGFFEDLFQALEDSVAAEPRIVRDNVVVYFLRVCECIDERVVCVRGSTSRSREQRARDMEVKDAMRERVIPRAMQQWYRLLQEYHERSPEIANLCLKVVQTYIEWIDASLVMGDDWVSLLYFLCRTAPLRRAACACLLSLVEKKQLPGLKLESLGALRVVESLPGMVAALPVPPPTEEAAAYLEVVARLVVAVAEQTLPLLDLYAASAPGAVVQQASSMTEQGAAVADRPVRATAELLAYLDGAVQLLIAQVTQLLAVAETPEVLEVLLPFVQTCCKLPALQPATAAEWLRLLFAHTVIRGLGQREEAVFDDEVIDRRKSLHNLIRLLHRQCPVLVLELLRERLTAAAEGAAEPEAAEAALRLFYELGEAFKLERLRDPEDAVTQLLLSVLQCDALSVGASSACVHLAFFEVMDRYHLFFMAHKDFISLLLQRLLLQPCGLLNRNDRVRARICCLFSHLLHVLKPVLHGYAADMVVALHTIIKTAPQLLPSDRREVFEGIGILLRVSSSNNYGGDAGRSAQLAQEVFGSVIADLAGKTSAATDGSAGVSGGGLPRHPDEVADRISYLTALVKGMCSGGGSGSGGGGGDSNSMSNNTSFVNGSVSAASGGTSSSSPSSLPPETLQLVLASTAEVMAATSAWRTSGAVRERCAFFYQQLLNSAPYEAVADSFEQYVGGCLAWMAAVPELSRLLRLLGQFVNRAGLRGAGAVARVMPSVLARIAEAGALSDAAPVVQLGVVSETARERLEVYRQLFAFVFSTATWGCVRGLLLLPPPLLSWLCTQMLYALTLPSDLDVPKAALTAFAKLATAATSSSSSAAGAAGAEAEAEAEAAEAEDEGGALAAENAAAIASFVRDSVIPALVVHFTSANFDHHDAKNFILVGEFGTFCHACARVHPEALQAVYAALAAGAGEAAATEVCVMLRDSVRFSSACKVRLRQALLTAQTALQQQQQQ